MEQKFIDKAKLELREDDLRKSQSLAQFREWISKHPFLAEARQDDNYLLQFLRARKYRMDEAFKTLERNFLRSKLYPQYFDFNSDDFEKALKMFEDGVCVPLSERNEAGQRPVLFQMRHWNTDVYSCYDMMRLLYCLLVVLSEEEETQIAGFEFIIDYSEMTTKQIMSPKDVIDLMDYIKNCARGRFKKIYLLNLPAIGSLMIEVAKKFLSEKMRKKYQTVKSLEDLKKLIDVLGDGSDAIASLD